MVTVVITLITIVRTMFLLLVGVSVSLVVLSPVALAGQRPDDPFLPYADLLLAEPPHDFVQRGFDCQVDIIPSFGWDCALQPLTGPYSEIRVTISYSDGHKRLLTFKPRQNLIIGDLVLLWGKPQIRVDADHTYFNWPDAQSRAIVTTGHRHNSYFQPVSYVAITFKLPDSK